MGARLHLTAPSWEGPTGPASVGSFLFRSIANDLPAKLSGGGSEGMAPCPATGLALSAREHRLGGAVLPGRNESTPT